MYSNIVLTHSHEFPRFKQRYAGNSELIKFAGALSHKKDLRISDVV